MAWDWGNSLDKVSQILGDKFGSIGWGSGHWLVEIYVKEPIESELKDQLLNLFPDWLAVDFRLETR